MSQCSIIATSISLHCFADTQMNSAKILCYCALCSLIWWCFRWLYGYRQLIRQLTCIFSRAGKTGAVIFGASWIFVVCVVVCCLCCTLDAFSALALVCINTYYFAYAFYYYTDVLLVQNDSCECQARVVWCMSYY